MCFLTHFLFLLLYAIKAFSGAKDKRDTPHARKPDDRIDHAAEQGALSTAKPCNDVKLKKSDTAPIQCTQNGENQRDAIHNHKHLSPLKIRKTTFPDYGYYEPKQIDYTHFVFYKKYIFDRIFSLAEKSETLDFFFSTVYNNI